TKIGIAPDGARALVISQIGASPLLRITGVMRDENGIPTGLTDPISVPLTRGRLLDASWMGADDLAVLIDPPGDASPRVVITAVGGLLQMLPAIPHAHTLAGGPNDRSIVVVTDEGALRVRVGGGWREIPGSNVRDPRYAG
ncbi:MAG: LpqB family beta-propeller domain-containing protein, partial [Bowdeniella nasicola]|nr:LpqB family beta-propeller domain-containing protein [Bowdeniella nasicola]